MAVIFKKINDDKGIVRKINIKPVDPNDAYKNVEATPDGKYIILLGVHVADLYDLNWEITRSFPIN